MSANPYDRRRPRDSQSGMASGLMVGSGFGQPRPPSPINLADIEAMIYSANRRGRQEAEGAFPDREQDARREAWTEGHRIGLEDGRGALLADIEDAVGVDVHNAHSMGNEMLKQMSEDRKRVSKTDLEDRLKSTVEMLERLIEHHRLGFARDLPF